VLRIRFTPDDLVRVRVSDAADPMWEIVGSNQLLQVGQRASNLAQHPWLQRSRCRLRRPGVEQAARAVAVLAPWRTYFPDFLTPDRHTRGFDNDLDTVLTTPVGRLARELGRLPTDAPPWVRGIAAGDPRMLSRVGEVIRRYHQETIAPDQSTIESVLGVHRAGLWNRLMRGGTEEMLDGLGPTVRWRPPYLETRYPVDRTIDLRGRGLLLVPSYFCFRMPTALADPELAPVLVYPVDHPEVEPPEGAGEGLAELIGSTRAAVLQALAESGSTSEIARRVGISVATASHHTTVLRDAGLITSVRRANRMVHNLSNLGSVMITGRSASTMQ
jgi:DNA-binding transcriptional ArsR family regulator